MASVLNDIKNGNVSGLYLFYGTENYKKRLYRQALVSSVVQGNTINYSVFEGRNIDWQAVWDAEQTMPFFAEKRLIVIENSEKFRSRPGSDDDRENITKNSSYNIERVINEAPETVCIAFFENEAAKNRKIFKEIASHGIIVECGEDKEDVLISWLAKGFSQQGKRVRKSTLSLMVERVGCSYDRLKMEFDKIVSYAGDKDVIDDADVLAVISDVNESRIFDLLDAISEKDVRKVLYQYKILLDNKEHPLMIIAMLRNQLRTMLQTAEMREKGMNAFDIAKASGKPPFVIRKTFGYLGSFTSGRIIYMLDQINDTDRKIKTGLISDQLGTELLLIEFSH